jgi:DNA-directed RNA polymerase subunit RPC12/RpoP
MKQHLDWRYNTNITRFVHCPYCGKKIDWKTLKNNVK